MATNHVAAVERALSLLAAFTDQDDALALAELARRTGLYKSTVLRLAATLEKAGYLRRLDTGQFRLGPMLLKLGHRYQRTFKLEEYVMPVLKRVAEKSGESASLYVREGDKRICLFRVNSPSHRVLHYVTPGTQLPLETGAAGKVVLAYSEPHEQAYAHVREEILVISAVDRKSDTAAIACPIFGGGGFVGAMSLAGPRTRFTEGAVRMMSRDLLEAAVGLSEALGGDSASLRKKLPS